MRELTYETRPGEHIDHACEMAAGMALLHSAPVRFVFNDIPLVAKPGSTAGDLRAEWWRLSEERSRAYWTPERLAEREAKEEADRRTLADHLDA